MTTPADRDPIATAKGLTDVVRGLTEEVVRLRKYGRTNRRFVVVDILLTLAVFLAGGIGVNAIQKASDANSAQLALCQAGNVSRAQQIDLWDYVLSLSKPPQTAEQRAVVAKFEQHLHQVFAPRDCQKLGR